jgi:hypothetical protein
VKNLFPNLDYEVSLPESKRPFRKVSEVIPKKDFIDKIHKQNDCIRESLLKINVVNNKANRRDKASLIEVHEQTYESLLSVGRIHIGWDSCRVYQHIDILRCFKCNQFGHKELSVVQTVPKIMNQKTAIVEPAYLKKLEHKLVNDNEIK